MKEPMRWLYVPFWFGVLVYVAWVPRWFPATVERGDSAYGQGQVIAAHLSMLVPAAPRAAVAFGVTVVSFLMLPPLPWKESLWVLFAAVSVEILIEVASLMLFGVSISRVTQLILTACGYAAVLVVSAYFINRSTSGSTSVA